MFQDLQSMAIPILKEALVKFTSDLLKKSMQKKQSSTSLKDDLTTEN